MIKLRNKCCTSTYLHDCLKTIDIDAFRTKLKILKLKNVYHQVHKFMPCAATIVNYGFSRNSQNPDRMEAKTVKNQE